MTGGNINIGQGKPVVQEERATSEHMKQKLINIIYGIVIIMMWIRLDHRIMENVRELESVRRFLKFVEITSNE